MADLSVVTIVIVRGKSGRLVGASKLLRHEGVDDLMQPAVDFFFRDVIGDLNIENNLDVFHGCTNSFLIACLDNSLWMTEFL